MAAVLITPLVLLFEREGGRLLSTAYASHVAHERQGSAFGGVPMDEAAVVQAPQHEHHTP